MMAEESSAKLAQTDQAPGPGPVQAPAPVSAFQPAASPRVGMMFTAASWTFNVRLGRNGREDGEGIIVMGEVTYRATDGERRVKPARIMVVKPDGQKQLDFLLGEKEAVITIPLEPLPMQRLKERLTDHISVHGMTLRVAFAATDSAERQPIEAVDFAFSSAPRAG
jgi:hypothetical protein